jgi:beta-galactosidase
MKHSGVNLVVLIFLAVTAFSPVNAQKKLVHDNLFDTGWKFHRGGAQGAEDPLFNDSDWRKIDLPHDWSIEDIPGTDSPFNIDAVSQVNGGFTTGGTGWYRKSFKIPVALKGKRFIIMFEGVYMNSDIWLNGALIGSHPYGYTSFWYDLTDKIDFEKANLLAVKVKNEGENSRWYSGSGIYRHVWLRVVSPVNIAEWGTYITSKIVNDQEALLNIKTSVVNSSDKPVSIKLITSINDRDGKPKSVISTQEVVEPGKTRELEQQGKLQNPELWTTDSPVLYRAVSKIVADGSVTDSLTTSFGVRSISFDAENGFLLNGKPLKLKGGCIHHDNGILGSRAYDRAEERRVELLKASGFNAIRSSHNPPSPAFLDACDRNGLLVIDEAFDMWSDGKNPHDYHLFFKDWWKEDIRSMVLRDRNHPSVILWSIGNEIPNRQKPEVIATARMIKEYLLTLDTQRSVTSAVNDLNPDKDPYFAVLDVAGYNYASGGDHNQKNIYEADHRRIPSRVMLGTESYPLEAFGAWMDVIDYPYVTGDFVWTAWDYIGEASIGWRGYWQKQNFFPWNLAFCGDIDICGWKRAQSYYRDVLWNRNKLSIWITPPVKSFLENPERQAWSRWHWSDAVNDWNWKGYEGRNIQVNIYSSCDQAELFLNGRSLGRKTTNRSTRFIATWELPYEPGTLKAIGYTGSEKVSEAVLITAQEATQINLKADRTKLKANGQDLCYLTIELTDENGILNPKAENQLKVDITGPATLAGIGNGDPMSTASYQLPIHKAWRGKCMVVLRTDTIPGSVEVRVSSPGLKAGSIHFVADPD